MSLFDITTDTYDSNNITLAANAGRDLLLKIESDFLVSGYWKEDDTKSINAYVWPMNTLMRCYVTAFELNFKTSQQVKTIFEYTDANYFENGRYRASTNPGSEGYWDDNGGILIAALEAYEIINDPYYLNLAIKCADYMLKGECPTTGQTISISSGLYQRENYSQNFSKVNTATVQSIIGFYKLYQITNIQYYKNVADRQHDWLESTLRDNVTNVHRYYKRQAADTGAVDGFTNNEAIHFDAYPAIANILRNTITSTSSYLTQAQNTLGASTTHYWDSSDRILAYQGQWAFKMIDALVEIYKKDSNTYWRDLVLTNANSLREDKKDSNGRYMEAWGQNLSDPITTYTLNNQAGTCRALLKAGSLLNP